MFAFSPIEDSPSRETIARRWWQPRAGGSGPEGEPPPLRWPPGPALLGLAALLALGAAAGHGLAIVPGHFVVFWAPSGLALGALLVAPSRQWAPILGTVWAVSLAVNVGWRGQAWAVGALFGLATVVEAGAGAAVVRAWAGPQARFVRMREVAQLLVISLVVAAPAGALIGAHTAAEFIARPLWSDLRSWWLGDVLGIIVFTPSVLMLARQGEGWPAVRGRRIAELAAILGLLTAAALAVYGQPAERGMTQSLLVPIFMWSIARFGALGLTLALLIVVPLASACTAEGLGPVSHLAQPEDRAAFLQSILIAQGFTGWLVAALWGQLRDSLEQQRRFNERLEEQVASRTAAAEANERRLRVALAAGHGFVFEWDVGRDEVRRFSAENGLADRTFPVAAVRFAHIVASVVPEDRAAFEESVRRALAGTGERYAHEYRVRRGDGSVACLLDQGHIERDERGRAVRLVGVAQDITERKQAEAERRVLLQRLDAVLQTPELIVFNQDRALRYTWVHNIAEGFDPGAVIGRTDAEALRRPQDVETLTRMKQAVLDSGRPQRGEVTIEILGVERSYDLMVQPQRDAAGAVAGITCACVDITERRAAEAALRKSEERLRLAAQTAGFGVHDYDVAGGRVVWSPELHALLGVAATDALAIDEAMRRTHPDDRERIAQAVARALDPAGDGEFAEEFRIVRADTGEVRWVFNRARTTFAGAGAGRRAVRNNGVMSDITERKRTEERLAASERRFRSIVDQAAIGVMQVAADGRIVLANQRACKLLGRPEVGLLGRTLQELTVPEDWPATEAAIGRLRAGGPDFSLEQRYVRGDGSRLWASSTVNALRDAAGQFLGLVAMVQDIGERKQVEENLRAAEERMQLAMFAGNAATWDLDLITGRNVWSESHFRLLGLEPTPDRVAREEHWRAAVVPEDLPIVLERWQTAERECREFRSEHRLRRFDNATAIWVRAVGKFWCDAAGRPVRFVGVFFDITAERAVAQALRESEETLRSFYESSPYMMGVVEVAADETDILHVYDSPATERFFGVKAGSTGGRWAGRDLGVPPAQRELWLRHYRESERQGTAARFGYMEKVGGEERWFSAAVACIGPVGARTRFSYLVEDVTERKRAEAALQEARRQLEAHAAALERTVEERTANLRQAVQQMEEFSYSVAHDLRAPLRAMGTYARIVQEDFGGRLDESGRDYLQRIAEAGARMDRLIQDLLACSQVARSPLGWERVSLERIVVEVRQQHRWDDESTGDIVVDGPLPEVRGHEPLVAQVVANLVANALKFMPPGRVPRVRIWAERRGSNVRLWVEDNGIGIEPESRARIWGMFERAHPQGGYDGTGVGLAIVRKALDRMGGTAGVESTAGVGSRFWMQLPAADEAAAATERRE